METRSHWEDIYKRKRPDEVSWFQPHLNKSLEFISQSEIGTEAHIIDIGGGASTLADDLLKKNYSNITVLDISAAALEISKSRLGNKAKQVKWIEDDITTVRLSQWYDLWHDRAVFHFLTDAVDRNQYKKTLNATVKLGGKVILATFSLKGPERCSNLSVMRHSPKTLKEELGRDYQLLEHIEESHQTPFGAIQEFVYCLFQRT